MKHIRKIAIIKILLLAFGMFAACNGAGNSAIIIAGSTSVQPYAEILAEEFERLYPDAGAAINIQGGGSAAGLMAAENGSAELGMSSRALKAEEAARLGYVVEIAKDGLAIIVHPDNPVFDLSLEEIRKIYTREITNWSELGGRDAQIHIIAREEGSGTRSAFEELVIGKGYEISPKAIVQASNGAVRMLVENDPNAIGFISLGLVNDQVKALRLDGVAATRENVINGTYCLYRHFLFAAIEEPTGVAKQFIDFILSSRGQELLIHEGLIPE
ncbi:MAG: phosphate ABC transporter substrate-binding protein [Clostridiales bacterium]|nr:phosphate ABC transporter substrate-binding protein [Clostridiales bacterium]